MGFGLPGENAHAPNEWFSVENFEKGMRTAAVLWEEMLWGEKGATGD
jgi:acetylornithine deacetylase/succinyl-diaminopimelate desuccinylase-like protein